MGRVPSESIAAAQFRFARRCRAVRREAVVREDWATLLDVWFRPGTTPLVRAAVPTGSQRPADLYLAGSTRSVRPTSLLTGCAIRVQPCASCWTHGFTVDESKPQMSKPGGPLRAVDSLIDTGRYIRRLGGFD